MVSIFIYLECRPGSPKFKFNWNIYFTSLRRMIGLDNYRVNNRKIRSNKYFGKVKNVYSLMLLVTEIAIVLNEIDTKHWRMFKYETVFYVNRSFSTKNRH